MIDPKPIQFLFQGGLSSIVDEFELASPQLLKADNVQFNQDGALDKRNGFIALSRNIIGGGQLNQGVSCQVFKDELLAFDGTFIYSYVESQNAWINRGVAISVINNQRKILSTRIAEQSNVDGTNLDGLECYIWRDDRFNQPSTQSGIRYSIIDSNTGSFVVDDRFIYQLGFNCKILAVPNSHQFNIYYLASDNSMFLSTISTIRPSTLLPFIPIITDGKGLADTFAYDVCLLNGSPVVAYSSVSGLTTLFNGSETTRVPGIVPLCVATVTNHDSSLWWIVYSTADGTFALNVFHNVVTRLDLLSAVNIAILEGTQPGDLSITYEIDPGGGQPHYVKTTILQSNNILIPGLTQRKVGLASKPFKVGKEVFVNTVFQSKNQATYFTLCVTQNLHCISKINSQVGGNYRTTGLLAQCDPFNVIPKSSVPAPNDNVFPSKITEFMFANQKKGAFLTNDNLTFSLLGVNASYVQFDNVNAFNSTSSANNLHIVGGVEKVYDGVSVVEDNFHLYPETADGYGAEVTLIDGGFLQNGHINMLSFMNGQIIPIKSKEVSHRSQLQFKRRRDKLLD